MPTPPASRDMCATMNRQEQLSAALEAGIALSDLRIDQKIGLEISIKGLRKLQDYAARKSNGAALSIAVARLLHVHFGPVRS